MSDAVFIGIDVSRDTLDVGSTSQTSTSQTTNDIAGIEALATELVALAPALVILEATGGYEFEAACALQARWPGGGRGQPARGARHLPRHGRAGQDRQPGCAHAGGVRPRAPPAP